MESMVEMGQRRGWINWLTLLCLLVVPCRAVALITIQPAANVLTLNWVAGDVNLQLDYCVRSRRVGGGPPAAEPYDLTMTGGNPFSLALGASQIPVNVVFTDLATNLSETLSPGGTTARNKTGSAGGCTNARLQFQILESDILGMPAGTFTRVFDVVYTNALGDNTADTVTVELIVPDSIRVSQLDDIDLGSYAGVDITASESLCVFRGAGGGYAVTVTGSGAGGDYILLNGISEVPFALGWDDGSGVAPLSPGVPLLGRLNTFSANDSCNNGASNNVTLTVTVFAADLDLAALPGTHSGVITILVEME